MPTSSKETESDQLYTVRSLVMVREPAASRDRVGITDTGKMPVFLGYCSITFDETEMVRIPVRCYQNDVRTVDVFRCNTGITPVNKILIH